MTEEHKAKIGKSSRQFTDEQVWEVRYYLSLGIKVATIAREMGTTSTAIASIRDGRTYKDVPHMSIDDMLKPQSPEQSDNQQGNEAA